MILRQEQNEFDIREFNENELKSENRLNLLKRR